MKNDQQSPTLNEEQFAYQRLVSDSLRAKQEAKAQYKNLREKCLHVITSQNEGAYCVICSLGFGWYCTESPDHICHYFTIRSGMVNHGMVALIPAGFAPPTQKIGPDFETEDMCLFCGNPEERK